MKKSLFLLIALTPLGLFASDGETDILQRTVNFVIFAAIIYYLLADKLKAYFASRKEGIQGELDKVQDTLKQSQEKVESAKLELEDAKKLAEDIIATAKKDISSIKEKIEASADNDISNMEKSLDEKIVVETKKAKTEVVSEVLNELLESDDATITQDELANIVLKKVA